MKFSDWLVRLDEQQKRLEHGARSEAIETICVEWITTCVTLQKQSLDTLTEIDGSKYVARSLRSLYTNNKEEFGAMLESLTKSVDQIVRASDVILEAVSAGAVPDAVLTRLKGERVSGEPVDLVRKRAEKELIDLGEVLASKFDEDKQFGDFVFGAGDDLLVSESLVELYRHHSLTGLSGFGPVEVVKVRSRRKKKPDPPPYFRAVVGRGRAAIDLAASGFEWLEAPTCVECRSANIVRWKRVVIEKNTWTGDDIVIARGLPGTFIVSKNFKDVCANNDVKNAIFLPAESYAYDFYPGMKDPSELESPSG